jgi:hypothetical protein
MDLNNLIQQNFKKLYFIREIQKVHELRKITILIS